MANIVLCYRNILETGTVTVTSENTSFPKYRLYDRDIGKLFKGNSTPPKFNITDNQGATIYEVNRLILPADHNLNGLALQLQYSINPFPITAITLGSGGTGYIINDVLTIVQAGASGGMVTVTGVNAGVITSVSLTLGGSNYSVENGLAVTGGTGTGATINVTAVDATNAASWTQSGSGLINKSFTIQTKQYWRFAIANPASAPELGEMYLTKDYNFAQNVAYGLRESMHRTISRRETGSGKVRTRKYGDARRYRNYNINFFLAAQKTEFQDWETHCEGVKSVYIADHDGYWMMMEILNEIEYIPASDSLWSTALELMEKKN